MEYTQALAQFISQPYLNIETFRKDGQAVQTPVWFVEDSGILYVRTIAESGKVKRIRRDGHVRVVPCGVSGDPKGEWVNGRASLVSPQEERRINALVTKKYGFRKIMFELLGKLMRRKWAAIQINLTA
jgi:PPOX class probable F420-dependent enzyme